MKDNSGKVSKSELTMNTVVEYHSFLTLQLLHIVILARIATIFWQRIDVFAVIT
jgi:hypothetical protein